MDINFKRNKEGIVIATDENNRVIGKIETMEDLINYNNTNEWGSISMKETIRETDGTFFEDLRKIEKEAIKEAEKELKEEGFDISKLKNK